MTADSPANSSPKAEPPGLRLAIDVGPLAVFFGVNFLMPSGGPIETIARIIAATTAFMIAMAIAMIVSRWKLGAISPMLWLSGGLVLVFGGLTIWFRDPNFIKMKPTIVYLMLAAVLAFGLWTKRPTLKLMLGTAYPGLDELGWQKLTRNWAAFFVAMAILNETVWRLTAPGSADDLTFWAGFKLWGAMPLTLLFAFANIPMLLRHGLALEKDAPPIPPEG